MPMDVIRVDGEQIDIGRAILTLSSPSCGAILSFVGTVRASNDGRDVEAVSYESFLPLAEKVLAEIAAEARNLTTAALRTAILHRVGRLEVGDVCTLIAVASPHRAEAYTASRYIIEQLKIRAPIWKEEHYVDGEDRWLDGSELSAS